jgi:Fur family ferric uptake transcriptional regulator
VKTTEQRTVILEELRKLHHHPGADEIYLRVKKRLPRISLGTVYRNLELLASRGLIRRLEARAGGKRFDPVVEPHGHFRCLACGTVEDLPAPLEPPRVERRSAWARERTVQGADYFGLCAVCTKGNRQAASPA